MIFGIKNLEDNFKIKIDSQKENLVNYIKELLDLTKDYITYNSILNKIKYILQS